VFRKILLKSKPPFIQGVCAYSVETIISVKSEKRKDIKDRKA
jgi:hypothetical protein